MTTIQQSSSGDSPNEFTSGDFIMTIAGAMFGFGTLYINVASLHGVGIFTGLAFLFCFGFMFAHVPTRLWGRFLMMTATLLGFYKGLKSAYHPDFLLSLLFTALASVSMALGFWYGIKCLNEAERQKIDREINDVGTVLFLSAIGFAVLFFFGSVPAFTPNAPWLIVLNLVLGGIAGFGLGYGLGWLELPTGIRVVVTVFSLAGFFLGLRWMGPETGWEDRAVGGTTLVACAFIFGSVKGLARAGKESARDKVPDE